MAVFNTTNPWVLTFGILGNIISFMVYLAPIPTFYRIYKKRSTEGFQSVPYVVALFSAMLWIYYAFIKTDASLLITINVVGCFIETIYIVMFITYAPRNAKVYTAKLLLLLNIGMFGLIVLCTLFLSKGSNRVRIVGWICVGFSVSVFAAPLSIMRLVIRTRSVEFMPFSLSFFLTLSAIAWFAYGFFLRDMYIALPNVLGFTFGVCQMVIYICYKDAEKLVAAEIQFNNDPEKTAQINNTELLPDIVIMNINKLSVAAICEVHSMDTAGAEHDRQLPHEQTNNVHGEHEETKSTGDMEEIEMSPLS